MAAVVLVLPLVSPVRPAWPEPDAIGAHPIQVDRVGQPAVKGIFGGLAEGALTVRSGNASRAPSTVKPDALLGLRFTKRSITSPEGKHIRVALVAGETLVGTAVAPAEDGVRLTTRALGAVDLSFEDIKSIFFIPANAGTCYDPLRGCPPRKGADVIYSIAHDAMTGTLDEATGKGLAIENDREVSRTIAWDKIRAVHIENESKPVDARALWTELELRDGTRLVIDGALSWSGAADLSAKTRSLKDKTFRIPRAAIVALWMHHPGFTYLSSLPFSSTLKPYYEDPPELGLAKELERLRGARVGRRPSGCPLRMGGRTFRRGIAVHSHSEVRFDLGGKYSALTIGFGIDDEVLDLPGDTTETGNVDAKIIGDGKVLWEARGVRGGETMKTTGAIPLKGVKELVLEVGTGADKHFVRDRANWVQGVLIRESK